MDSRLILMIAVATAVVMLMAFSLVFFALLYKRRVIQNKLQIQEIKNQHQKSLLKATVKSQEEEQRRLGAELHDSVGAMLAFIKMNLSVASNTKNIETVKETMTHLDDTIQQVRSISHQMMPIVLKKYGVKKAIENLFQQISNDELEAKVANWGEANLDEDKELALYRIVQELTNNTLKHAQAKQIRFFLMNELDKIIIKYEDNGIGFPDAVINKSEGMGMWNILNRAQILEAKVRFSNPETGGARVEFLVEN